jgi:hypothetical protein
VSPNKRRMSNVLVFSAILLIAVGISAGLYFFKIQKNEDYQNQLHFRELNVVAHSFNTSLYQFESVGKNVFKRLKSIKVEEGDDPKVDKKIEFDQYMARARASESLRNFEWGLVLNKTLLADLNVLPDGYSYYVESFQLAGDKNISPVVKAPTKDFLPSTILSFPLILIADGDGEVLARKEYFGNSTNAADLQFQTVSTLLNALAKNQRLENNIEGLKQQKKTTNSNVTKESVITQNVTYSGTLDLKVSSITYRIFIQPVSSSKVAGSEETYYVLGFVPLSDMQLDKLSVSSTTGLWILMALLILTAAIPILKIRFIPSKHLFRKTDISLFFAGTILLLGIITITLHHNIFYSYLINTKYLQAESIFKAIGGDFKIEVEAINKVARDKLLIDEVFKEDPALIELCDSRLTTKNKQDTLSAGTVTELKTYNCVSDQLNYSFDDALGNSVVSFVESVFRLNHQGVMVRQKNLEEIISDVDCDLEQKSHQDSKSLLVREPVIRISKEAFNFGDLYLGHRGYFKRAISCDLWFENQNERDDCRKGFMIERIKNVTDSRLSTQFAYADFDDKSVEMRKREVKSASVKLRTFLARILPENFGYAVFGQDGLVLYHSDESRVLQENILVDTYGDKNIETIMHMAIPVDRQSDSYMSSVRFETEYRDAKSLFVGGALSKAVPWKLVVFYKTKDLARSSLWMVVFSVSLVFVLLILVFIWNRFGTKQYFWSKLLSFSSEHQKQYANFAWLLVGGIVFCQLSMGLIVDLYGRISLWFFVCCALVSWLSFKLNVIPFDRNAWAHPSVPFACLGTLFLALFIGNNNEVSISHEWIDLLIFAIGTLIFGLIIFYSNFSASKKTKLSLFAKISTWCEKNLPQSMFNKSDRPYRYSRGYVVYLAAFLWIFSVIPASMFINATNHFLLDYQAYNQSQTLNLAVETNKIELENYYNIFGNPNERIGHVNINKSTTEPNHGGSLVTQLYCRLLFAKCKTDQESKKGFSWITVNDKRAYVDPMLHSLASDQNIGGAIHKGFYHFAQAQMDYQKIVVTEDAVSNPTFAFVNYNGNGFLIDALIHSGVKIFFSVVLLFLITLIFAKKFIVHALMGEHIPENFRTFEPTYTDLCFKQISKIANSRSRMRVQLIRTPASTVVDSLQSCLKGEAFTGKKIDVQELLQQTNEERINFMSSLRKHKNKGDFIVLGGLESVAFNQAKRVEALKLLQNIDRIEYLNIILVSDIAPLFRLCKQSAYPGVDIESCAKIDEVVAWTNLLYKYEKLYNWNPSSKKRSKSNATVQDVLEHEGKGWPALNNIKALFEVQAEKHPIAHWKPDQIVEYFASHAGAIYRDKWEVCTTDERLTLFQLANGASINPANLETLEQLVKRGYVYRDCGWFIVNESFRRFILFAESESTFAQWMDDVNSSTWQFVRVPIIIAVLVLAGVVVIGSGQSLQSVLASATATLGVIPLLLRNLTFFKSTPVANSE